MKKMILPCLLWIISFNAYSIDECIEYFDACNGVKIMANELKPHLPQTINSEITMNSVITMGRNITFTMQFSFSREEMIKKISSNFDEFSNEFEKQSINGVCANPNLARIIKIGTIVNYNYRFSDNSLFKNISINNC